VILAPDGKGNAQLKHSLAKAKEFLGKFKNCSMSQEATWIAVSTIIEPAIIYPLLNTSFSSQNIQPIDSVLSQLKCTALGFNRNFPRAVIHGPKIIGVAGIPSLTQKNTKDRVTYFLYNLRKCSTIRDNLEASIIYTQIEVGSFDHFLTLPFATYGHLATEVSCVQFWGDTEPEGLVLHPAHSVCWTPTPITPTDRSIMDIAVSVYNKKGSAMIN
jgi:hypothetical protein